MFAHNTGTMDGGRQDDDSMPSGSENTQQSK